MPHLFFGRSPFEWRYVKAFVLAPFAAPAAYAALLSFGSSGLEGGSLSQTAASFARLTLLGAIISYPVTALIGLLLLVLTSLFSKLRWWVSALVGILAGLVAVVPLSFIVYGSSGDNSGPLPPLTLSEWLLSTLTGGLTLCCVLRGLSTAVLFHLIAGLGEGSSSRS